MMAILCCGALAFAVTGCRYDDANQDALTDSQATVSDVATTDGDSMNAGKDIETENAGGTDANAEEANLSDVTGVPFDQDPNYARCTDVDFAPVYFGFDATQLAPAEMPKIEAVAQHLQAQPNRVVIIEGNCDERGSNEYNLSLGELRAIAIRDYLVSLGIDAQRVQTKSYGEEKPAVAGQGEGAWSKNRRGEFAIFQHK
ncbi:MAG: OmpA family protein [Kiritimatiellae bacterium]|nr:OmpA family protein [Kiritimatiellia bacterium]